MTREGERLRRGNGDPSGRERARVSPDEAPTKEGHEGPRNRVLLNNPSLIIERLSLLHIYRDRKH